MYPLALAYLQQSPPDYQNGIWYAARAAAVAPAQSQAWIEKYAKSQYMKYHQGEDGWDGYLLAQPRRAARRFRFSPADPRRPGA